MVSQPVLVGDGYRRSPRDELTRFDLPHGVLLIRERESKVADVSLVSLHPRQILVKLAVERRQFVYGTVDETVLRKLIMRFVGGEKFQSSKLLAAVINKSRKVKYSTTAAALQNCLPKEIGVKIQFQFR